MPITERTKDVFEDVGNYPKPPLIPLPSIKYDSKLMEELALKDNPFTKFVVKTIMRWSGFLAYYKKFPEIMEAVFRQSNFRFPGLYAPAISATLALRDDPSKSTAVDRAVSLVFGARSLYKDLFSGQFEPDQYQGQPLEMGQYPNLFSTSLTFEGKKIRMYKSNNIDSVTVLCKGKIFIVDMEAREEEQKIIQLKNGLHQVIEKAEKYKDDPCPGILTAASNETQPIMFPRLSKKEVNRKSLEMLRHSFLTICLDLDLQPKDLAEAALWAHSTNYENRWFHSSLQLVIFGNAKACAICNFTTYLDGNTMMRGAAEIQKRGAKVNFPAGHAHSAIAQTRCTKLDWQIHPAALLRAKKDSELLKDHQQATFEINNIGRTYFKTKQLAAVPVFIIALQQAAEKLAHRTVWIQQFLTLTRYRCMDLNTSEVSTPQVREFLNYINHNPGDKKQATELLHEAINSQLEVNRQVRSHLSIVPSLLSFVRSRTGLQAIYVKNLVGLTILLLKILGQFALQMRDIVVSHPEIYNEVPIVGRPGIRLPYVRCFGLHYQILDSKIVITFMPGLKWQIPNTELITEIEKSLKKILDLLD